jgi:hypothetical protein
MAAKRVRNHHDENVRRNALAVQRGEANRYQQRKKIETGVIAPIEPKRVRSAKTMAAQAKRLETTTRKPFSAAGVVYPKISDKQRAQDWSTLFARSGIAKYEPSEAATLGISRKEYTSAYLRAFVVGDTRYSAVRHNQRGGSTFLYYWMVTLHGYFSIDEYESRYGPAL